MKTLLKLALAAGIGALVALPASAQNYKAEYKVSTVVPAPFPWGLAAERWAELVEKRSEGRIHMKIYPGVSLVSGDQTREFAAMRQGIIDMAVGSTINWSPQIPELNIFSMPFLMPDYAAIDALTGGEVGKTLFDLVRKQGVEPLGWAENGFRELTNSKHPVRTPKDLEGLKIRVVGSPLFNDTFTALGANPTQMSWADAKPALTTGAVDGQENPLSIYTVLKMNEIGQGHVTLWHYVADPLIFAVSDHVWKTFTDADKELVRQAALDAGAYGIEVARDGLTGENPQMIKDIRDMGVDVVDLTDEERQAFIDATRDVYKKWKERIGVDLVNAAEKAVAERSQ